MKKSFAVLLALILGAPLEAQTTIPASFDVLNEDFEKGTLEDWTVQVPGAMQTETDAAWTGSLGLAVQASQEAVFIKQSEIARAVEGYLTFWFDPNSVAFNDPGVGWIPGRSISLATIKGPDQGNLVALRFYRDAGAYKAYIGWKDGSGTEQWDLAAASPLADSWQQLTIGFRQGEWIAWWLNGSLVDSITSLTHSDPYASIVEIGKTRPSTLISPSGSLYFDDISLHMPLIADLWVDGANGSDAFDGMTPGTALATITRASDFAGAGTTVHIQPGIYRESVRPAQGGRHGEPALYRAEEGPGTVVIRGTQPGSDLVWQQLGTDSIGLPDGVDPSEIWWTSLASWDLPRAPRFVFETGDGQVFEQRLPLAREPDWQWTDEYKPSEFWWLADGGWTIAGCDPHTNADPDCDVPSRSFLFLTDRTDEAHAAGGEAGNLTSLPDLTGATLVARDCDAGSFLYWRTIQDHDETTGRVSVSPRAAGPGGGPGLGWATAYFVENHPALLDSPGEWWWDPDTERLYLYPPSPGSPADQGIEISARDVGFDLRGLSHITLQDLVVEGVNGDAISNRNFLRDRSTGITIRGSTLRYAYQGISLNQLMNTGEHLDKEITDYLIADNSITLMDLEGIRLSYQWDGGFDPNTWSRAGVHDVEIRNNSIVDIGFRQGIDSPAAPNGVVIKNGERIIFEGNFIGRISNNGFKLSESIVQSSATWGFTRDEIKNGTVLIKDNIAETSCLLFSDCSAIRVWGTAPDAHVFRDVLIMGNTVRNTYSWSRARELRSRASPEAFPGAGGSGLYLDHAAGLHLFRNIAYNNGKAGIRLAREWRDGENYIFNNVVANNLVGILLGGLEEDLHGAFDTRVRNNILVNSESYGLVLFDADDDYGNLLIDSNLHFLSGWSSFFFMSGAMQIGRPQAFEYWQSVSDIAANTTFEQSGQEADAGFLFYDPSDREPRDASTPDFRLRQSSPAIDAGTPYLPTSLANVLAVFGLSETAEGAAFDQGAFEGGSVCADTTVTATTVSGQESYSACNTIFVGPAVEIQGSGDLLLAAGGGVVFNNGVSVLAGGSLSATTGIAP